MRTEKLRNEVARAIATAVTRGGDPDVKVLPEWPQQARFHGGFISAPPDGAVAPLWHFFLEAADAAIGVVCDERE